MGMYWYNGGTWKETIELWGWNGSWSPVRQCYIWDGLSWRIIYAAPASLDSFSICQVGSDPTYGNFRASWTYTTSFSSDWKIALYYSFNSGSTWTPYDENIDITSSPYSNTLEGYVGFTSLDNTYFKLRMIDVDTSTVDATNSPSYAYPTWLIC